MPVLTPRLSGLWLGLVTPVYAPVGRQLVQRRSPSMIDAERDLLFETVACHVSWRVGPIAEVYHWPGPEIVHVDVLHVPPHPRRRCHTLITCGMSRRPMPAPREARGCRFGEFYLSLPESWPIAVGMDAESYIWPLRELSNLVLLPHLSESWIWWGHTIGAADPTEPITPGLPFTAWIVGPHMSLGHEGCVIRYGRSRIHVMVAVPIYPEELNLARLCGSDALFRRLSAAGVTDVLDVGRGAVVG